MRLFIALVAAALLLGVPAGSADSAKPPAKPPLVRLHWHPVATGVGESEPDLVQPRVSFREDLDSPSGTSPLCTPLRYPALYNGSTLQLEPGNLTILGQFALTTFGYGGTDLLERCHSSWRRWLYGQAIGSSQMVLWSDNYWVSRGPQTTRSSAHCESSISIFRAASTQPPNSKELR